PLRNPRMFFDELESCESVGEVLHDAERDDERGDRCDEAEAFDRGSAIARQQSNDDRRSDRKPEGGAQNGHATPDRGIAAWPHSRIEIVSGRKAMRLCGCAAMRLVMRAPT